MLQGQMEVRHLPTPGQGRVEVVDARGDALLGQVGEEGLGVLALAGDLLVLRLGEVEHVHVELPAALEGHRHFLAHEHVGQPPQLQGARDRVVIGEGDEVHAARERGLVDRHGLGVALAAHVAQHGEVGRAGVRRVHVKVAAHQACSPFMPTSSCFKRSLKLPPIAADRSCEKMKDTERFRDFGKAALITRTSRLRREVSRRCRGPWTVSGEVLLFVVDAGGGPSRRRSCPARRRGGEGPSPAASRGEPSGGAGAPGPPEAPLRPVDRGLLQPAAAAAFHGPPAAAAAACSTA